MYSLSALLCPVTVIMYWGFVHESHVQEINTKHVGDQVTIDGKLQQAFIVHSIPFICFAALMYISDCVLIKSHSKVLSISGFLYTYYNYRTVTRTGVPLYPFLQWNDGYVSLRNAVVIILFFTGLFYFTATIDEMITQRNCLKGKLDTEKDASGGSKSNVKKEN